MPKGAFDPTQAKANLPARPSTLQRLFTEMQALSQMMPNLYSLHERPEKPADRLAFAARCEG